jgi:hypothetical protein
MKFHTVSLKAVVWAHVLVEAATPEEAEELARAEVNEDGSWIPNRVEWTTESIQAVASVSCGN